MAVRKDIIKVVERYKEMLSSLGIRPRSVILFGSHAKGRPHLGSDIDLIVLSDDFKRMDLRQRLEVLGRAAARIMEPVGAKGYTLAEVRRVSPVSFLSDVLRDGVIL